MTLKRGLKHWKKDHVGKQGKPSGADPRYVVAIHQGRRRHREIGGALDAMSESALRRLEEAEAAPIDKRRVALQQLLGGFKCQMPEQLGSPGETRSTQVGITKEAA